MFGKTRHSQAPARRIAFASMPTRSNQWPGACHWRLSGTDVWLDASGAMFVPAASLLVVSDLHFEKGSHYAERGQMIPPYDTRATLKVVEAAIRKYRPRTVLSLGDTFHDGRAEARMMAEDRQKLIALCEAQDWIFVLGNHDPLPPKAFRGRAVDVISMAGLRFTHEPEGAGWHVAGHLHPCALAVSEGRGFRRSCFISDGTRMILPSMGAYTGGLNVLDEAFAPAFPDGFDVFLRSGPRVFRVPVSSLRADNQPVRGWRLGAKA